MPTPYCGNYTFSCDGDWPSTIWLSSARSAAGGHGQDYTTTNGTLSWADGEAASKSITVPIIDDGAQEGAETFTFALSNPTGGATLGATTTATVTIQANDVPPITRKFPQFDFGGDGQADPTIRRLGVGPGGQALWWPNDVPGFPVPFPDTANGIAVSADYDGDTKADIAFYRPSSGLWFGQKSSNGAIGPQLN